MEKRLTKIDFDLNISYNEYINKEKAWVNFYRLKHMAMTED